MGDEVEGEVHRQGTEELAVGIAHRCAQGQQHVVALAVEIGCAPVRLRLLADVLVPAARPQVLGRFDGAARVAHEQALLEHELEFEQAVGVLAAAEVAAGQVEQFIAIAAQVMEPLHERLNRFPFDIAGRAPDRRLHAGFTTERGLQGKVGGARRRVVEILGPVDARSRVRYAVLDQLGRGQGQRFQFALQQDQAQLQLVAFAGHVFDEITLQRFARLGRVGELVVPPHQGADAERSHGDEAEQGQQHALPVAADETLGALPGRVGQGVHGFAAQVAAQVVGQFAHAGVALLRIVAGSTLDDRAQRRRNRATFEGVAEARATPGRGVLHDLERRVSFERGLQGDDFEQHQTERALVAVRAEFVAASLGLLGRHVARRADDRAVLGLAATGVFAEADGRAGIGIVASEQTADAPVHQVGFAVRAEHDVGRLEVAMDDALAVRVVDRLANLDQVLDARGKAVFLVGPGAGRAGLDGFPEVVR